MSGHSKWSTIKHKKAAADAKRGKLFTKLIKELTIAARAGGGDIEGNPRLRTAVDAAKAANMPQDNVKRAILKGTGELPGTSYEDVAYEGYGPGGVAIYVETLTDNRMRTTPEIRHLFTKYGGNLGEPNSVAWMFEKKGHFSIPASDTTTEDRLMELVLEAGADDLQAADGTFEISTSLEIFPEVQRALERANIKPESATIIREAQNTIHLDGRKASQCLKLLEMLEEHDDVQNVYANLEVDDSQLDADVEE
jgi:YebC/PmpR family DNA-binding regulatory protein